MIGSLLAVLGFIVWPKVCRGHLSRIYLFTLALIAWVLALGPRLKISDGHATDD